MSNPSRDLKSIFGHAIEFESAEARADYLANACGDNAALRAEIDGLLSALDQAGEFMQSPADAGGDAPPKKTVSYHPVTEVSGTVIGPYKLLEQIGEGGMGAVYMADQQSPIQRRVALKIIKPGLDSRQVIARFEAERQALALMDHPNIAKVFDASTTESERPYFVMELVRGIPITEYCDQNNLSLTERLELFLPVCQAVQHAHQKGIVHRDLKPSNVMVTLHDGRPVPKVIDFGVAKAINQRLTEKTLFTNFAQMVGTPLYMSPEQAEMSGLDVDTRSDIYSLGVLLYELLTSTTPFDRKRIHEAAFDEIRRIIREEEPPRPSNRVSTLGETRTTTAAHRKANPNRLSQMLKGELDWVVMKALEKDRTHRYETASGLARDIQCYLTNEPVEACPPSTAYRFRKFARRNRATLATATLVAVALMLGLVGSTWQAIRATQAEGLAERRLVAETKARTEGDLAREAEAEQRRLAEAERMKAEEQRVAAESNFQKAREAVDRYFTATSENELLNEAGMAPLRKELLEAALEYYDGFAAQQVDDPVVLGQLAAAHSRIAQIYAVTGSAEWPTAYGRCLDIVQRLEREGVDPALWAGSLEGTFRYDSSTASPRLDDPHVALHVFERGVKVYDKLAESYPKVVAFQEELATNSLIAAYIQNGIGQPDQALRGFRRALGIWERSARKNPAHPHYADHMIIVFNNLPVSLRALGRDHEIERFRRDLIATIREIFGNENHTLAHMLRTLADKLARGDRLDEAEGHLREAQSICETLLDHRKTPRSLPALRGTLGLIYEQMAEVLMRTGRPAEAAQLDTMASAIASELASQSSTADYLLAMVDDLVAQGKLTAALEEVRAAARLHAYSRSVQGRLMTVLVSIGDAEQTLAIMRENAQFSPDSEPAHHFLGRVLEDQGQFDEAVREFQRRLEINPETPWSHSRISKIRQRQNRLSEALVAAQTAIQIAPNVRGFHDRLFNVLNAIGDDEHTLSVMRENAELSPDSERAHNLYGRVLKDQGRLDEAVREFQRELAINPDTPGPHFHIAEVRLEQNRLAEALDAARLAIHRDPHRPFIHDLLRQIASKIGDSEQTLAVMRENAQLWPDSEPAHHFFGRALKDQEHFDESVREFELALAINPKTPWSHYNISSIRLWQDRLPEALDAARSAIRLRPTEFRFHDLLLEVLNKIGDDDHTLNAMRENARLWTDSEPAHHLYGRVLKDQGRLDEAVREFERGLAINPDTPWSHYHLAEIRMRQNKLPEALDAARLAVRSEFTQPQFRARLLEVLVKIGNTGDEEAHQELVTLGEEELRELATVSDPGRLNDFAWSLAAPRESSSKIARLAVQGALRACQLRPGNSMYLNTLGVAQYRQEDYPAAIKTLQQSRYCADGTGGRGAATDCYFLAMSHAKLDQAELAESWYRAADQWMALFVATNAELSGFRQEAIDVLGIAAEPLVDTQLTPQAEQDLVQFCKAADPDAGWMHRWLGERLAERGAWVEANEQLTLAAQFDEDAQTLGATDEIISQRMFDRALLCVESGQLDVYRRFCQAAVKRIGETGAAQDPSRIGIQCKLAPGALKDYTPVLELLDKAVSAKPKNWLFRGVRAHLLYRSGDAEAAAEQLEQVVSSNKETSLSQPWDKFFLAMAHHDLGHESEAQRYFHEAIEWIDRDGRLDAQAGTVVSKPLAWRLRLDLMLLRAEAGQLLGITQPESIANDVPPEDDVGENPNN